MYLFQSSQNLTNIDHNLYDDDSAYQFSIFRSIIDDQSICDRFTYDEYHDKKILKFDKDTKKK